MSRNGIANANRCIRYKCITGFEEESRSGNNKSDPQERVDNQGFDGFGAGHKLSWDAVDLFSFDGTDCAHDLLRRHSARVVRVRPT
jgi:hypothetical protein